MTTSMYVFGCKCLKIPSKHHVFVAKKQQTRMCLLQRGEQTRMCVKCVWIVFGRNRIHTFDSVESTKCVFGRNRIQTTNQMSTTSWIQRNQRRTVLTSERCRLRWRRLRLRFRRGEAPWAPRRGERRLERLAPGAMRYILNMNIYIYMYVFMYANIYNYIHMYVCMYVCINIYVCIYL